ncbi:hypothetical protein K440DRAFT_639182 [Wilcoxina mikolae CBS 423.85]|nr:hypothetical protein K440DRAFT_639182 [Wilcoxina mikolae CBS 423.85]
MDHRTLLSGLSSLTAAYMPHREGLSSKDIHSVYSSGDPAQFKTLNSIRREGGEAMISRLLQTIYHSALCARAEALRGGMKCTISLPTPETAYFNFDVLGGCNYHASLVFEDVSRAPIVGPAFFDYDSDGNLIPVGPFSHSNDYYTALIKHRIDLIKTREIAVSAPVDMYLVYKTLLDHLPPNDPGPFFLRHVDSRDANFLVDDGFYITGIIDWELAMIVPKSSAFQSPLLMYNLRELYHEEIYTPSEDENLFAQILRENGRDDLATLAAQKMDFRVDQCIETDPHDPNFRKLFPGWWKAVKGVETFYWDCWYKEALEMYGDDRNMNAESHAKPGMKPTKNHDVYATANCCCWLKGEFSSGGIYQSNGFDEPNAGDEKKNQEHAVPYWTVVAARNYCIL